MGSRQDYWEGTCFPPGVGEVLNLGSCFVKEGLEEVAAAGFLVLGRPGLSNLPKRSTTFIYLFVRVQKHSKKLKMLPECVYALLTYNRLLTGVKMKAFVVMGL